MRMILFDMERKQPHRTIFLKKKTQYHNKNHDFSREDKEGK